MFSGKKLLAGLKKLPVYKKRYNFGQHFCLLIIGFQVFLIYKKYPQQSKIYIFSEEI